MEDQREFARRHRYDGDLLELAIRFGLLGILVYWSFILVQPFVPIVIWSSVLAVALYPLFSWVAIRLGGRRKLAATLVTLLGLLIVVGPVTWLGMGLIKSFRDLAGQLEAGTLWVPPPSEAIKSWPLIGERVYEYWALASTNLTTALADVIPQLKPLGEIALDWARSAGSGVLKFLVSVVIAGFLFVPGPSLVQAMRTMAVRIDSTRAERFVILAGATIRTVSRGVIGVALLQAAVGGAGLFVAGVPGANLLTLAILVLAIIQIGPALIAIPVVIWSWMEMPTATAVILTGSMAALLFLDNVFKPIVIARGLTTPMLVIIVGVIGGVLTQGIIGLFLGPVILAVAWELLSAWIHAEDVVPAPAMRPVELADEPTTRPFSDDRISG